MPGVPCQVFYIRYNLLMPGVPCQVFYIRYDLLMPGVPCQGLHIRYDLLMPGVPCQGLHIRYDLLMPGVLPSQLRGLQMILLTELHFKMSHFLMIQDLAVLTTLPLG